MAEHNHTQSVSATTWTIVHNLNVGEVALDVMVDVSGSLTKVLPLNVVHTSNDVLTATFSIAQTGNARLIG